MPIGETLITLSSIPPRFEVLGPTLESLVAQDRTAAIELWIPRSYRRFPEWDGCLPDVPAGVTIRRCDRDWGPATKIVPAVLEAIERNAPDRELLLCDDDNLYAPDWHSRFHALRRERPNDALASIGRHLPGIDRAAAPRADGLPRMQRLPQWITRPVIEEQHRTQSFTPIPLVEESGHADLFAGWGGVMLRPSFFAAALAEGPGSCWAVDDVWLSAMLALNGTKIWVEATILPPTRRGSAVGGVEPLAGMVVEGRSRAALDLNCVDAMRARHGIWTPEALGLTVA